MRYIEYELLVFMDKSLLFLSISLFAGFLHFDNENKIRNNERFDDSINDVIIDDVLINT